MNTITAKLAAKHHVKFKHVRNVYEDESVAPKGGITYAVSYERGLDVCKVATAVCSNKDVFCKETGRSIAINRLDKGQYVVLPKALFALK